MKAPITITLEAGLVDKIDKLTIKRGTNRSETIRHILGEYFRSGTTFRDLIDELERMKGRNLELKYQMEDIKKSTFKWHEETMDLLLIFAGLNPKTAEIIKERFPQYCSQ